VGRGWGRRWGPTLRSGGAGRPVPTWSQRARAGDMWSSEPGEAGSLTGGPRLQFQTAVKFNLKLNSTRFKLFNL
jgi:hypothetical protein